MDALRHIASSPPDPVDRPQPAAGTDSAWRMLDHVARAYDDRSSEPAGPAPGAGVRRSSRQIFVLLLAAPTVPLLLISLAAGFGVDQWFILAVGLIGIGLSLGLAVWLSGFMSRRPAAADRDSAVLDEKVIEAGKLASIGLLAAGVAHEINNPLAIMIEEAGWIGDLLEDPEPASPANLVEMQRAVDQIQSQGRRCRDITHELLSFARKSDDRSVAVDLVDLVGRVKGLLDQRRRYTGIEIISELSPRTPAVTGAPQELEQVLFNLIHNALDAVDPESGRVLVRTGTENGRAVVQVADNGPGIPEEVLSRIFDPFFTTKPTGQGAGLGLSICYGIVRRLGGTIDVASRPGQGTTFTVTLPAREAGGAEQEGR